MRLRRSIGSRVAWVCGVTVALATRAALAQDAPAAPSEPPPVAAPDALPVAEPNPAPAEPPSSAAPTPSEPPATAQPPDAVAPPAGPAPASPDASTKTGSAAFAPVPGSPKQPASRAAKPATQPRRPAQPEPASERPTSLGSSALPPAASSPGPVAAPPDADESHDSSGIFGPFRIGVLAGGGLPDLLSLGGMIKLTRFFGAGINIGLIPTVKISYYGEATLSFQEYDAYGHIFPFGGAFFLGAGVGYATVKGTLASHFDLSSYQKQYPGAGIPSSLDVSSQASVRTLVLTPQLGLLHTFGSGLTLGADVGAQVPIAPSQVDFTTQIPSTIPAAFKSQIQTQYVDPNDAKVRSTLEKIGRTPIPTFGIKIGWLL